MIDNRGRKIDYLRISVTDKCNLRCIYCMPNNSKDECELKEILSFDEIVTIVKSCASLGITKIRITGGEPLVRNDICDLIGRIKDIEGIEEVSITTNGVLLSKRIDNLIEAGLDRINISLDTLKKDRFKNITKIGNIEDVFEGIKLSLEKGIKRVKLNVVIIREVNYDEVLDFVTLSEKIPIDIRFIELMPIGQGKNYSPVAKDEILKLIKDNRNIEEVNNIIGNGPATYIKVKGAKGNIGFISAISHEFCENCNRIRLTQDGFLKLCLHWSSGIDLKSALNNKISTAELTELIKNTIKKKPMAHDFKYINKKEKEKYDNRKMFEIGG